MRIDYDSLRTANAIPCAASMIETFRAIGYNIETAVADIIDNSISANAKNVWVTRHWHGDKSFITIKDDGCGMNSQEIIYLLFCKLYLYYNVFSFIFSVDIIY